MSVDSSTSGAPLASVGAPKLVRLAARTRTGVANAGSVTLVPRMRMVKPRTVPQNSASRPASSRRVIGAPVYASSNCRAIPFASPSAMGRLSNENLPLSVCGGRTFGRRLAGLLGERGRGREQAGQEGDDSGE